VLRASKRCSPASSLGALPVALDMCPTAASTAVIGGLAPVKLFKQSSAKEVSMLRHTVVFLMLPSLSVLVVGCSQATPPSEMKPEINDGKGPQRDNKEGQRPESSSSIDPAAVEFVDTLKEAFNSWSRGETIDDFRKAHPTIQVLEPKWAGGFAAGDRLIKYQVVSAKLLVKNLAPAAKRSCELVVSLEIQEGNIIGSGNKVRMSNKYHVQENKDDTWIIFTQGEANPALPSK
jgi:hypothetical protein